MDPVWWRTFGWAMAVVVLLAVAGLAVLLVRRQALSGGSADGAATDWIAVLNAARSGHPAGGWAALATTMAPRAADCPSALRGPLVQALDHALARLDDPLARAHVQLLRTALAASSAS
jgi:hypothetical protein